MIELNTLLPVPYNGQGIGYTCGEILSRMGSAQLAVTLTTPYSAVPFPPSVSIGFSQPDVFAKLFYRFARPLSSYWTEQAFLHRVSTSVAARPVAYLWSEASLGLARSLKKRQIFVVREKTNCGKAFAKRLLDDAYRRIGVEPQHGITERDVEVEATRLKLADAVYCPNRFVEESLAEIGVSASARLPTSYGFDPARMRSNERLFEPAKGTTFLFVGSICVRKGAHILLNAWAKSGIKGRLILAGGIEPVIASYCLNELARPDVIRLRYVRNVAALYRSADVFVFPSLEEGGPQVTYEAAACGLPTVVSPMGAGHLTRNGDEGYVIDPYEIDDWIDVMRTLDRDEGKRRAMGDRARARSEKFAWSAVGRQRRDLLMAALLG